MQIKAVINERGVITIPAALRQSLGLKANDELILEETDGGILMRPAISVPLEVYTEQRIREFAREDKAIGTYLPKRKRR
jgi:AbrB family looped-hinge helix DNA binding protein